MTTAGSCGAVVAGMPTVVVSGMVVGGTTVRTGPGLLVGGIPVVIASGLLVGGIPVLTGAGLVAPGTDVVIGLGWVAGAAVVGISEIYFLFCLLGYFKSGKCVDNYMIFSNKRHLMFFYENFDPCLVLNILCPSSILWFI